MDAFSPIRTTRIEKVRGKIFRKLYDAKELKEETVNKLIQSEDLGSGAPKLDLSKTQKGRCHSDSSPPEKKSPKANLNAREKKIKEAKEKRQKGYYNHPEVFSKVAQRLIDLFQT